MFSRFHTQLLSISIKIDITAPKMKLEKEVTMEGNFNTSYICNASLQLEKIYFDK